MKNLYISQALTLKNGVAKNLPNGLESTADVLLEFISKRDDEHIRLHLAVPMTNSTISPPVIRKPLGSSLMFSANTI